MYRPCQGVFCLVCCVQSGLLNARAFGSQCTQLGQLNLPFGIAVTAKGDVCVAEDSDVAEDYENHRLSVLQ